MVMGVFLSGLALSYFPAQKEGRGGALSGTRPGGSPLDRPFFPSSLSPLLVVAARHVISCPPLIARERSFLVFGAASISLIFSIVNHFRPPAKFCAGMGSTSFHYFRPAPRVKSLVLASLQCHNVRRATSAPLPKCRRL